MKGLLALLLAGLFPGPAAFALVQDTAAPQSGPHIFTLVLTDELIEKLRNDPNGLNSEIPQNIRGQVVGVKLTYQRPPLNSSQPTTRKPPVASSIPKLDPSSISPPPATGPQQNSQSNLYENPMGSSAFNGPQLPLNNTNLTGDPQWPFRGGGLTTEADNGYQGTGFTATPPVTAPTTPPINTDHFGHTPPPASLTPPPSNPQLDLLQRQANQLEANRVAWEQSQLEEKRIAALVDQRVLIEKEAWLQAQQNVQLANLENQNLLAAQNVNLPNYSPSVPTHPVDHRTQFGANPSIRTANNSRLNNYRQPPGSATDRTLSGAAMNPQPTNSIAFPPASQVLPTTLPSLKTDNSDAEEQAVSQANAVSTEKTNFLLLLFLVASGAVNVFLGLIARSFYVRYGDLADELRETFSATV